FLNLLWRHVITSAENVINRFKNYPLPVTPNMVGGEWRPDMCQLADVVIGTVAISNQALPFIQYDATPYNHSAPESPPEHIARDTSQSKPHRAQYPEPTVYCCLDNGYLQPITPDDCVHSEDVPIIKKSLADIRKPQWMSYYMGGVLKAGDS
ncbi:hypothetical protein J6590_027534, partial [Homalodisca vitripennis]